MWPGPVVGEHLDVVQRVAGSSDPATRAAVTTAAGVHRAVAYLLAAAVLVQAVVAGQAVFGDWDIEVHGWMGNGSFVLGLVLLGLAVASRAGRVPVTTAAALVAAMFVQVGLGYAGRTALGAASWHIPLGVAIFGLSVYNLTLVNSIRPRPTAGNATDPAPGRSSTGPPL